MLDDDLADAGRGDEQPVGRAALHDLGVAGDDRHLGLGGRGRHAGADRRSSAIAKPSSMTKAAASASGRAAAVARSLTVPATARRPMSPPGKRSGCTTCASVVKAMRPAGRQRGRVVEPLEHGVGERRHEDVAHQVAVELAAAAVAEQDALTAVSATISLRSLSAALATLDPRSGSAPRTSLRCDTMQAPTGSSGVQRRAEQRAVGRVEHAAQHLAAAAPAGSTGSPVSTAKRSAASNARNSGAQRRGRSRGSTPSPRQSASHGSNTRSMSALRDEVALGAHRARV